MAALFDSVLGNVGAPTGTYTIPNVTANRSLEIFFGRIITASAGTGGTISPTTSTIANGYTQTYTVTPNAGYVIDIVTGCGGTLTGNTYTTAAITGFCTVTATFIPIIGKNNGTSEIYGGLTAWQTFKTEKPLGVSYSGQPLLSTI